MRQPVATISLIALGFAVTVFGIVPRASAQETPVEEQIVDAFQTLFGKHPGQRVNHAKGIVAEGSFKASPDAAGLTRAAHFQAGTVPVTVRFSNATGVPNIPDGDPNANPHGLAVKFSLPDGSETDIVINSLHFFPVATPAEFRDLLLAVAASKPDSPKPTKLEEFVSKHPAVAKAGATVRTPESFATEQYFGINAFGFTNKAGRRVSSATSPNRWPASNTSPRGCRQAGARLLERRPEGPAGEGAGTVPPAGPGRGRRRPDHRCDHPWPEDRKRVELGVLTITAPAADNEEAAKSLLFLPGNVTDGVAPSDDPLIAVRDASYAVSFARRSE